MSYDYARERDEASLEEDWHNDMREMELEDARYDEVENGPCVGPYRCVDRMCGALDCSNCYPGGCDDSE